MVLRSRLLMRVLGMVLVQATARLYEQGGLNHDLSFVLTAVAFSSLERPDTQVMSG